MALSDMKARKLGPGDRPLSVGLVAGLSLHPGRSTGTGKFIFRFVSPETGKRRDMGMGTYPTTGLAEARQKAFAARTMIEQGIDPIEQRRRATEDRRRMSMMPTFSKAAELVFEEIAPSFRNPKHRAQWITTLRTYVLPRIGGRPVADLEPRDFAEALRPIWLSKPETAGRVRQRCDRVMIWCIARGYCTSNPVSAVHALLPKQPAKAERMVHQPSVPWRALPDHMPTLFPPDVFAVGRSSLLFLILTAARSGEVRGATWDEIDAGTRIWTIPAERMKTRITHRVPLSRQAITLLNGIRTATGRTDFVFTTRGTTPISEMTMTKVLRQARVASDTESRTATAHGFRATFRDWASENGYPRDLAERALAHKITNQVEAAYHRTDLLDQRRPMMQAWADYCCSNLAGHELSEE